MLGPQTWQTSRPSPSQPPLPPRVNSDRQHASRICPEVLGGLIINRKVYSDCAQRLSMDVNKMDLEGQCNLAYSHRCSKRHYDYVATHQKQSLLNLSVIFQLL